MMRKFCYSIPIDLHKSFFFSLSRSFSKYRDNLFMNTYRLTRLNRITPTNYRYNSNVKMGGCSFCYHISFCEISLLVIQIGAKI